LGHPALAPDDLAHVGIVDMEFQHQRPLAGHLVHPDRVRHVHQLAGNKLEEFLHGLPSPRLRPAVKLARPTGPPYTPPKRRPSPPAPGPCPPAARPCAAPR